LFRGSSGDTNDFIAAGVAGSDRNGGALHGEEFGEKLDAGLVGAAVAGRGREGDLQGIPKFPGDGVVPGARVNADGEGHAVHRLMNPDHCKAGPVKVWSVKVWSVKVWSVKVWSVKVWSVKVWSVKVWSIKVWSIKVCAVKV
jgi:hypothetical protein